MRLSGINHVATLTSDTDRLHAFYRDVFEAEVLADMKEAPEGPGVRLSIVDIGNGTMLNVFQIEDNTEAARQAPMFERGRIDHIGFRAKDLQSFEEIRERLMELGSADDFVTDGEDFSLFFRDPDRLEGEVLVENPDALPGVHNPPGTPAIRYTQQG